MDVDVTRGSPAPGASRRQLNRRAALVGVLMRNCIIFVVAVITVIDPAVELTPVAAALIVSVGAWSAYRIWTRSLGSADQGMDLAMALVGIASTVQVVQPNTFALSTSPAQVIAGAAVAGFALASPFAVGGVAAVMIVSTYAVTLTHAGATGAFSEPSLYLFALQWATASAMRALLLRVAASVDSARAARQLAESKHHADLAVVEYEREQLALLHDTAASTLMMVGQGDTPPLDRIARQARRDLQLLKQPMWTLQPGWLDIVAELRKCAQDIEVPVGLHGCGQVWVQGGTATAVVGAAREVMSNVDRHAQASRLDITAYQRSVVLQDDGQGFDASVPRSGHGLNRSVIGRMNRVGGDAQIHTAPGSGCTVELRWGDKPNVLNESDPDAESLVTRIRKRFGMAIVGYALLNLLFMIRHVAEGTTQPLTQYFLAAATAVSAVLASLSIVKLRLRSALTAAVTLLVVTIAQPAMLPAEMLGRQEHWAWGAVGWCVLPMLMAVPFRVGASVLVTYWIAGAIVPLVGVPSTAMVVAVGIGTASILGPQLFALAFNTLIRAAAAQASAEAAVRGQLLLEEHAHRAVRAEYHRRFADLVDNVVEVLESVSETAVIDSTLRRRARGELRRLRMLFDQADAMEHPLLRQLRAIADEAEYEGVDVTIEIAGDPPGLSEEEISSILDPLERRLRQPWASARIVVTAAQRECTVSVMCRGDAVNVVDLGNTSRSDVFRFREITATDAVWAQVRYIPDSLAIALQR